MNIANLLTMMSSNPVNLKQGEQPSEGQSFMQHLAETNAHLLSEDMMSLTSISKLTADEELEFEELVDGGISLEEIEMTDGDASLTVETSVISEEQLDGAEIEEEFDTEILDINLSEHKVELDILQMNQDIQLLSNQVTSLLVNVDEETIKQVAPQLLNLLQQLTRLLNEHENSDDLLRQFKAELTEEDSKLMDRLLNAFKNRTNSTVSRAYSYEAEVTTEDVAKWLTNALQNQNVSLEEQAQQVQPIRVGGEQVQMSHIEQYVIHLNSSDRVEKIQDQLVRQLTTAVKQSNFLKGNNITQLSFTLNPNNLGQVNIQLTEVNGEMTVKIIASSLAAKNMLEANIHQLKHLFAPHNITIERNSIAIDEVEPTDEQLEEEHEEQEAQEENNDERQEEKQERPLFAQTSFESILTDFTESEEEEVDD